jgi:hypothetical protein
MRMIGACGSIVQALDRGIFCGYYPYYSKEKRYAEQNREGHKKPGSRSVACLHSQKSKICAAGG